MNIRQRQAEGIAAAKARCVHFGRRPNLLPDNFEEAYHQWITQKYLYPKRPNNVGCFRQHFLIKPKRSIEDNIGKQKPG